MSKPSTAQRRVLEAMAAGASLRQNMESDSLALLLVTADSESKVQYATFWAMHLRGWLETAYTGRVYIAYQLTDKGWALLKQQEGEG